VTNGLIFSLDAYNTKSYVSGDTTTYDLTTNENNGTLINGVAFDENAWDFDGVNDYVDLGLNSEIIPNTNDFTFEFWVNPNNWGSTYMPLFTTNVNGGMWIGKNGVNFVLRSYSQVDDLQTLTFPEIGEWTHLVVSRIGSTTAMYYNTELVVSGTVTKNYVSGNSRIGDDFSNNNISSKISVMNYYNRGLTSTEIKQNYEALKHRYNE
jgi:hypothetical protein